VRAVCACVVSARSRKHAACGVCPRRYYARTPCSCRARGSRSVWCLSAQVCRPFCVSRRRPLAPPVCVGGDRVGISSPRDAAPCVCVKSTIPSSYTRATDVAGRHLQYSTETRKSPRIRLRWRGASSFSCRVSCMVTGIGVAASTGFHGGSMGGPPKSSGREAERELRPRKLSDHANYLPGVALPLVCHKAALAASMLPYTCFSVMKALQ
jgi:hypothetical protein